MTNREWLNSLSNEQFLKAIHIFRWGVCNFCSDEFGRCNGLCYENQLAWLEQEHNESKWRQIELKCDKWRGLRNDSRRTDIVSKAASDEIEKAKG